MCVEGDARDSNCQYETAYTTRKMTSYGIIRFKAMKEKARFKRWLADVKEPLVHHERKLNIGDNETKEQRTMGRAVAKLRRAFMETAWERRCGSLQEDWRSFLNKARGAEPDGVQVGGRGVEVQRRSVGIA